MSENRFLYISFKTLNGLALYLLLTSVMFACRKDKVNQVPDPPKEEEVIEEVDLGCNGVYTDSITELIDGGTIESGMYLAAYPGSWWEYSNDDYLTCDWADLTVEEILNYEMDSCIRYLKHTNYTLPKINGNYTVNSGEGYIFKDSILALIDGKLYNAMQISLIEDDEWFEFTQYWMDDSGSEWWTLKPIRKVIAYHDSLQIPNGTWYTDVVEITQSLHYDSKIGGYSGGFYHLYYAKEIGLIWEHDEDPGTRERYLVNYFIAPH